MSFTGSSIEQLDRQVKLLLGNPSEVAAFWEELPKQPIEVLVAAALPRVVRMGKVNGHAGVPLQLFVVCHLGAIVQGQAPFEVTGKWCEQCFGTLPEGFLGVLLDMAN